MAEYGGTFPCMMMKHRYKVGDHCGRRGLVVMGESRGRLRCGG